MDRRDKPGEGELKLSAGEEKPVDAPPPHCTNFMFLRIARRARARDTLSAAATANPMHSLVDVFIALTLTVTTAALAHFGVRVRCEPLPRPAVQQVVRTPVRWSDANVRALRRDA
jgi:hypothetical protein